MKDELRRAWTALADDLDGDAQAVRRFFVAYRDLLVPRIEAAAGALARGDEGEARSTLLTVRSTSLMVGAEEVGAAVTRVLDRSGARRVADERRALDELRAAARTVLEEVTWLLSDPPTALGQPIGSKR
ncbi:hypothetical protein [Cellulosimicrobium cellulans]|uniref:HPt domain-containing protein n=1 Tax=Cellulosimicrobium cellulans TaxID=1710 RepID=A0A4Y4DZ05_CELCE|nr:hypothetical protein [Cellulosimicrobium cellulans]GED08640.1 hypothetical protein CCE02nite_06390 [Cellulosimicrobium cellulans]